MNTTGSMQPTHTEINSIGFKLSFCGHKIPEAITIKIPNSFLMKQDFLELALSLVLVQLLGVNSYFSMFTLICEWFPPLPSSAFITGNHAK